MAFQEFLARILGYLVGFGSIMLYTPIAVRLCRQKHADGLVMSTWWLKICSYLLSDVYFLRKGYELSTYVETVVITVEAFIVLLLVAHFQKRFAETTFWLLAGILVGAVWYGLTIAPEALVATGQMGSAVVNVVALIPQFWHNYSMRTKGDYSPLTAGLAFAGCGIRLFTTITLNNSDPVLMFTFVLAMAINGALMWQIFYYGIVAEGLSIWQVLLADVVTAQPIEIEIGMDRDRDNNESDGIMRDTCGTGVAEVAATATATSPIASGTITNLQHHHHHEGSGLFEIGERNPLAAGTSLGKRPSWKHGIDSM